MIRLLVALAVLTFAFPTNAQETQYSEAQRNFFASSDIEWPENEGIVKRVGLNGIEIFGGASFLLEGEGFSLRSVKTDLFERRVQAVYVEVARTEQGFAFDAIRCFIVVEAIPMSTPWDHNYFVQRMRSELNPGIPGPVIAKSNGVSTFSVFDTALIEGQENAVIHKFALASLDNGQQILAQRSCFSADDTGAEIESHFALRPQLSNNTTYFEELAKRYEENLVKFADTERNQAEAHESVRSLSGTCYGSAPQFDEYFKLEQRFRTEQPYLSSEHFILFHAQLSRLQQEIVAVVRTQACP